MRHRGCPENQSFDMKRQPCYLLSWKRPEYRIRSIDDKKKNPMSDSKNADENSATEERGKRQDFDTPWKKIVKAYFKEFVHFFFPEIARQIDWTKGYEFLDKELLKIAKDAAFGGKRADIMARVHLLTGEEEWVLCHIEIQGQDRKGFSKRMYVYNYRGFDFFDRSRAYKE